MAWAAGARFAGFSGVEPWLPVDPRHPPLAVGAQEPDPTSVLAFTRGFLAWRKRHGALAEGEIRFLDAAEPVLVFIRGAGAGRVLCAFNLGAIAAEFDVPAGLAMELLSGHGLEGGLDGRTVRLPAHGGLFAAVQGPA
jgi:alpha-glucosidase